MDLNEIDHIRILKGVSFEELAEGLPISQDGLNKAFKRGKVKNVYLQHIKKYLGITEDCSVNTFNTTEKPERISSRVSYKDIDSLLVDDYGKLLFIKHIHNNESDWLALPEFKKLLNSLSLSSEMESMKMELEKLKNQFERHIKEIK